VHLVHASKPQVLGISYNCSTCSDNVNLVTVLKTMVTMVFQTNI